MSAISTKNLLIAVTVTLVAAVSIWYFTNPYSSESQAQSTDQVQAQPQFAKLTVTEPFQEIPTPTEKLVIENPTQPTILTLTSGTTIDIPANAFVDEQGQVVTTPVTIRFEEFHNPAEIIASGIPMRVRKSGGEDEWMQTAGMFEINGSTENRPVKIAEGKSLAVSLPSKVDGAYDFWFFDEKAGNWLNQGPSATPQRENIAQVSQSDSMASQRNFAAPKRPKMPTYDEKNNLAFYDLDVKQCPELQGKSPLVLNYAGNDEEKAPKNNKWVTKQDLWTKKQLKPTKEAGVYQLTLLGDSMYSIPVRLALQGAELEQAKADYKKLLAEYEANMQLLSKKEAILEGQAIFRRTMNVQGFGIHNYDIIWKMEDAIALQADFDFGAMPESVKELITVYLITGNNRTVVGLPYYDWQKFRFSPSADNKLVAVLPDNKIALFTQSDFKKEMSDLKRASGSEYVFEMNVEKESIASLDDLQAFIKKADR